MRRSARPTTRAAAIRRRRQSRRSTISQSPTRTAPPCSSRTSVMCATAIWYSRTSSGRTANARCCSASSKTATPSTLTVVNAVKHMLHIAREAAPPGMVIKSLFDQSVFVTSSLISVLREGATAAGLTALMILLFLGSWRPTVVVMISIPLPMLSSLVVLYFLGETINTMTLGGLALAVGILVDDSTVTIENTYRLLDEEKMPLPRATLHGAAEIAVPTLVSTLAISCVFTSVVFLEGPAKYLFTPLGLAVVFAMLASYGLSRTLTPITIGQLLKGERRHVHGEVSAGLFSRLSDAFERGFERLRDGYSRLLEL